jgi:hypothetical protein
VVVKPRPRNSQDATHRGVQKAGATDRQWDRLSSRSQVIGQVAEWFKAHAWKACGGATHSRVRIPPCPLRANNLQPPVH